MPLPDFDLGQTFKPKYTYDDHPHVVINTPSKHKGIALCVNMSEYTSICDQTCVLNEGDHKIVTKKSFIFYARPKQILVTDLKKLYLADKIDADPELISAPLLDAIIAGTKKSDHFPEEEFANLLDQ